MSAEMCEEIGDGFELAVKIDGRNTARGSHAKIALDRQSERGTVIPLGEAPRRQPEDAAMPPFSREHENPLPASDLRFRKHAHVLLDLLALRIHAIQLAADLPRSVLGGGGEEVD